MENIFFKKSTHIEAADIITEHLKSMEYPLDSYMETKLTNSEIAEVQLYGNTVGYVATIDEMIWFYYITPSTYYLGAAILEKFIKESGKHKVTVLTCDVAFNGVLSDFKVKLLSKEGRYFSDGGKSATPELFIDDAHFRKARKEDISALAATTKGYYADFSQSVTNGEVYVLEKNDEILGCGTLKPSGLFKRWVSLGVTVVKAHRKLGVGTTILWHLKETAYKKGMQIMAGSWYFNTIIGKSLTKVNMLPIAKEMCYEIIARDNIPDKSGTLIVQEDDN